MKAASSPTSEAYCASICFYVLFVIADYLNGKAGYTKYRVKQEPIIKEDPEDHRKDKKADLVFLRLTDEYTYDRTIAIVEVKLAASNCITNNDKDHLAQLFYETRRIF